MEGQKALRFHQRDLICVLKMNESLTGLERQNFHFVGKYPCKAKHYLHFSVNFEILGYFVFITCNMFIKHQD